MYVYIDFHPNVENMVIKHYSEDYAEFRATVPLKNICVDSGANGCQEWSIFDAGPKNVSCPLVMVAPACGTADIYYKIIMELANVGYRCISVDPRHAYWTVADWCEGFRLLLDHLNLPKVHLYGASLGGFLIQKFVEYTCDSPRVVSLFLCNTFVDTNIFNYTEASGFFWMVPAIVLRKMFDATINTPTNDPAIRNANSFVKERLKSLSQNDLASRLTLNCRSAHVNATNLKGLHAVTIMDVFDWYALTSPAREHIYGLYPYAKLAQLKSGGNFPYLSRPDQVCLHLRVHFRRFLPTPYSCCDLKSAEVHQLMRNHRASAS